MLTEYAVIDHHDRFVLYTGTFMQCMQVQAEGYGGLTVVPYIDVADWDINVTPVDMPDHYRR